MAVCLAGRRSRCARTVGCCFVCIAMAASGRLLAVEAAAGAGDLVNPVAADDSVPGERTDTVNKGDGGAGHDSPIVSQCLSNRDCSAAWFGVEYLLWQLDGSRVAALVTAGPATTSRSSVGQLGDPDTVILFGGGNTNDDWRSGYRFNCGYWLDCCHSCSISADYFNVGGGGSDFVSPQDPGTIVGRPFFNSQLGQGDLQFISIPNELDGTAEVKSSDGFQGAGLTLNRSLWRCCDPCCKADSADVSLIGGHRYYRYASNLSIGEDLTVLPGTTTPLVPGTTFQLEDRFRTRNEFNGGEFGLQGYRSRGGWWLDGMAKLALGVQQRSVTIDGQTTIDVPGGGTFTGAGGLLTAGSSNIGTYDDSTFVVVPEFRLGVGASITSWLTAHVGYDLILWNDVARAGSSLPPGAGVDPRNLPPPQAGGGAEPEFPGIRGSQLVAQGFDVGVMCQW